MSFNNLTQVQHYGMKTIVKLCLVQPRRDRTTAERVERACAVSPADSPTDSPTHC